MSTPDLSELSAAERLALSRERMRQSMVAAKGRAKSPDMGPVPNWLDGLSSIPGASSVIDAVRGWWMQHPMRLATQVAADAGNQVIKPLAQRHPIGLVFGALLVGAVLVWAKPWRGVLKPALLAGLLPQLISRVMAQVPAESWMAMLASLTQRNASKGETAPATAPAPATPDPATPPAAGPLH